ncbi:MFS transporter [Natrinema gelatinilyticum]|uniref:MFS transporter n=1 Tax=Natrinema gelatinilyticum TaxID=2961571 RepID=UPI0020C40DC1|nr:MFS transporter [Natrinema gelatinilyticum]
MLSRLTDGTVYYGWVIALACFIVNGVVFGMTYSFGVFLDPLVSSFGASMAQTSLVYGVQLFVLYAAAAPMGVLVEWVGPRRGLVLAAILLGGGMVTGSQATSLLVLILTYSLISGAGMSLAFIIGYATPLQWFQQRRGLATGIASAGLGIGMVVIAPTASLLVTSVGWRGAFPLLGAGLGLTLVLAALAIADDPTQFDAVDTEFPDGRPTSGNNWHDQLQTIYSIARSRAFVLLFGGYILLYGTLYVMLNHIVNYAAQHGIQETGVLAVSVIGGTTTITRFSVGGIADRLGRLAVFVTCGAVMALALIGLSLTEAPLMLLAITGFFGVGYGGTGALLSSVPADLFGGRNLNALFGFTSLSLAVPALLGPWLASLAFDQLGTYIPIFFMTGVFGLAGVASIIACARYQGNL